MVAPTFSRLGFPRKGLRVSLRSEGAIAQPIAQTIPQTLAQSISLLAILTVSMTASAVMMPSASALPRPDRSLDTNDPRRDTVNGEPAFIIDGGTSRGQNLFHSFREFIINGGDRVYFDAQGAENILSRVTGGNGSRIFGTLGVLENSDANLFLMDPRGILFGPGAQLDLRGSFMATTADEIRFAEGRFGIDTLTVPDDDTLTINPTAFVFNQIGGDIRNEALVRDPNNPNLIENNFSVPDGETLILLGGDVTFDNGYAQASEGRIDIGGLSQPGLVRLRTNRDTGEFRLRFPRRFVRADVTLTNGSVLDVTGADGGNIALNGNLINILEGSNLCAGIGASSFCGAQEGAAVGSRRSRAGNILLSAADTVTVSGTGTRIGNNVNPGGFGNQDNIFRVIRELDNAETEDPIDTLFGSVLILAGNTFQISDEAIISTSTSSNGSAGVVFVSADTISLSEGASLFSNVLPGGTKRAGGILLLATSDFVQGTGSVIESGTAGRGAAGRVEIGADTILITDDDTQVTSSVFSDGRGASGQVDLSASRLFVLRNNARIASETFGDGDAGGVAISSGGDIVIDGVDTIISSSVGSPTVQPEPETDAGIITLTALGTTFISNGAAVESVTFGRRSNAGGIGIFANILDLGSQAELDTSTFGRRSNAGAVVIGANQVLLSGESLIFNNVESGAVNANAGGVIITATDLLRLSGGAQIQSIVRGASVDADGNPIPAGEGDAGAVVIEAGTVVIEGLGQDGLPSSIFTTVGEGATGDGGFISLTVAGDLRITETVNFTSAGDELVGGINAETAGTGSAGSIFITTGGNLFMDRRGSISSRSEETATGDGGQIVIAVGGSLGLFNNSGITVSARGENNAAGDMVIAVGDLFGLDESSFITATTASGEGGNLFLGGSDFVILRNGSQISTTAGTAQAGGNGGDIELDLGAAIFGIPFQDNNITAQAFEGDGGNIQILNFVNLFDIAERSRDFATSNDITASSEFGIDGRVTINELDVDPVRGVVELPALIVDPDQLLVQACPGPGQETDDLGALYVTGRGGLPPSLDEIGGSDAVITPWVTVPGEDAEGDESDDSSSRLVPEHDPVAQPVEAQDWVRDENGEVWLVATSDGAIAPPPQSSFCPDEAL